MKYIIIYIYDLYTYNNYICDIDHICDLYIIYDNYFNI